MKPQCSIPGSLASKCPVDNYIRGSLRTYDENRSNGWIPKDIEGYEKY
jgi:hypothetical protein